MPEPILLASGSATRAKLLRDAGLDFTVHRPTVDEAAVRDGLRAEGLSPRDQADALAEVKALSVSRKRGGFVIGADQMLALGAQTLDKPVDRADAVNHLRLMRGTAHHLITAAVIAKDGAVIWRRIETPRITMRAYSDAFIETYLDTLGTTAFESVGAYQLEGLGAQLFSAIEGDYYSILGLPLLAILDFLRIHRSVAT
jgi:septum formation protein